MKKELVFVTGYFGAPIRETAESAAAEKNYALVCLDDEIEKADGRPVLRICMVMGEHEYRNKEYEMLTKLTSEPAQYAGDKNGVVVYCGDGVLHDEMSRDIIEKYSVVIAGTDMTPEQLWLNAKNIENSTHAFMHFGNEDSRKKSFEDLYGRQHRLYTSLNR